MPERPVIPEPRLLAAVRSELSPGVRELRAAPWLEGQSEDPNGPAGQLGVPVIPSIKILGEAPLRVKASRRSILKGFYPQWLCRRRSISHQGAARSGHDRGPRAVVQVLVFESWAQVLQCSAVSQLSTAAEN
jgi:hypothetical protein